MGKVCSIFSQILQLISHTGFDAAVRHQAERYARAFTSWGQFVAMLFCQLAGQVAARDLRRPGRQRRQVACHVVYTSPEAAIRIPDCSLQRRKLGFGEGLTREAM